MSEHSHSQEIQNLNKRFLFGIILNIIFVLVEAFSGIYYNSLALLSDAGHNLSDVASLLLALLAFRLAKIKPNLRYTYGFSKTTILVSLLNALILLFAMGGIVWESIERFQKPSINNGTPIAIVAGIGIIINAITAWLFLKDKDKDLNIKGVYLNMLSDTLVSCGVVVAGILMNYTGWYWLDSIISIIIALIILISTIFLLKNSFNLTIDGVPEGINISQIKEEIEKINGVVRVNDLHVWAISTTLNSFTAHIETSENPNWETLNSIKESIRIILSHHNILHTTIEFENKNINHLI